MALCDHHQLWTRQQRGRVQLTNESRSALSNADESVRVGQRPGELHVFLNPCIQEHDRYGGGSVMVWGEIHSRGRNPSYHIQGTLNGLRYRDEIVRPLIIPALQNMGTGSLLQDDNATPHRAHVVGDFLQRQQVHRLDWPSRSPDLAPIEHLWDILDRRAWSNHPAPAKVNQLLQFLQQEWLAIPQQTLMALIESMRRRCAECLAANGGHTRY